MLELRPNEGDDTPRPGRLELGFQTISRSTTPPASRDAILIRWPQRLSTSSSGLTPDGGRDCQTLAPSFIGVDNPLQGAPAETLKVDSWCIVVRQDAIRRAHQAKNDTFPEIVITLAWSGKVLSSNKELLVVQFDSAERVEAVAKFLLSLDLQMTRDGKFCDYAIVHGTHGLALECDWLHFTPGEVAFRTPSHWVQNLGDFTAEGHHWLWIDQIGHGFLLESNDEHQVWLDFSTGRTVVNLKP
jgi:hypothetical protein